MLWATITTHTAGEAATVEFIGWPSRMRSVNAVATTHSGQNT